MWSGVLSKFYCSHVLICWSSGLRKFCMKFILNAPPVCTKYFKHILPLHLWLYGMESLSKDTTPVSSLSMMGSLTDM